MYSKKELINKILSVLSIEYWGTLPLVFYPLSSFSLIFCHCSRYCSRALFTHTIYRLWTNLIFISSNHFPKKSYWFLNLGAVLAWLAPSEFLIYKLNENLLINYPWIFFYMNFASAFPWTLILPVKSSKHL